MKKIKLAVVALTVVIGLPVVAVGALYAFIDPNDYRAQIAEALSKQLGRAVKLEGPIKLSLSWSHGVDLAVSDVSVANPSWASRPHFAKIGQLGVGVGLQPLLQKKLAISAFKLGDADIQLETNAAGQTNYDFKAEGKTPEPETAGTKAEAPPVALHIDHVAINDSKLTLRGKDGKSTTYVVKALALDNKGGGIALNFTGEAAGVPVKLDLTGGALEQVMGAKWPFAADIVYAAYKLHAEGTLENGGKSVTLSNYAMTAGSTKLAGQLAVKLAGVRPAVEGTLTSEKLDLADLKPPAVAGDAVALDATNRPAQTSQRLFSDEPLKLDALKAVDAKLDVSIAELPLGETPIKQLRAKLDLVNGRLSLAPLTLLFAGSAMQGEVRLDAAAAPAQLRVTLDAPRLDMAELAKGMMEGKADASFNLNTLGNSLHDFASNADGAAKLVSGGGALPKAALAAIGGNLLDALAAGAGSTKLNCLAARFKIQRGQMQSDGVLLDTDQATLMADGGVDLGDEKINMLLRTRAKLAKIDAFAPAVRVSGALTHPRFAPDTASTAQKVMGLVMGGDARVAASDNGVPEVTGPAGQNACLYTLEHPPAAKPAPSVGQAIQDVTSGKAKLKDVGGKLLQGLFGQ